MIERLLTRNRVLVCAGSGGVGKTTIAAALGVIGARRGLRVLVLTIDPARRLATALGLGGTRGAVSVPEQDYPGELWAEMIDPEAIFTDYIRRVAPSETVVRSILENKLYQQLSTTLSGSQEFTSLVRLHDAATSGRYDLVILDTPPAGHAVEFLEAPERLISVFDGRVARWLTGDSTYGGVLGGLLRRGTHAALGTLQLLTGKAFIQELTGFFDGVRSIAGEIGGKSRLAHELLTARTTAFVLISGFDAAKLQEGEEFARSLEQQDYRLRAVIMNRAFPEWYATDDEAVATQLAAAGCPAIADLYREMRRYYAERGRDGHRLRTGRGRQSALLELPELAEDITGLAGLEHLAERLLAAAA
jgi:anion-transporting  ArsA/GET3 family ATPase